MIGRMGAAISATMATVVLWCIELYQTNSSSRPPRCRYLPTCSRYAHEAIAMHGAFRGSWLALRRIGRCHPLHAGGHDPVPAPRHERVIPVRDHVEV